MLNEHVPPITILRKGNDQYPWRLATVLGKRAPDQLYARGNLTLLERHAISFCGARDASEKGIRAASACARSAVAADYVVTSGNARGVDRATHYEALKADGETILVLPEGISRFRIAPELREIWDWNKVLVLSQFDPEAIWRSYQAMERNSVIMALSCAMVVVEAGEKGGTRAAGEEALKLRVPLFAIDYGFDEEMAPGNRALIARGACKIKKSRDTGQPNLRTLLDVAHNYCSHLELRAEQSSIRQESFL